MANDSKAPVQSSQAAAAATAQAPAGGSKPARKPVTTPWKPASALDVPADMKAKYRSEGYVLRWCSEERLSQHIAEGWEPVKGNQTDISPQARLVDGTQLTNLVRKGALILCKMPIELKESRDEYFSNLNKTNLKCVLDQNEYKNSTKVEGSEGDHAYGKIEVETKTEL